MSDRWQNDPATEKQKEKMRFFGCTWEGNITKGQASDAISECMSQFPDKEIEWQNRPATAEQKKLLRKNGEKIPRGLTYSEAKELIEECECEAAEEVQTEEEIQKEKWETRVDHYHSQVVMYWEIDPSRKKVEDAIRHLDATKPSWDSLKDLVDEALVVKTLEALKPASGSHSRKKKSSREQGCLSVLVACFVLLYVIAKFIMSE